MDQKLLILIVIAVLVIGGYFVFVRPGTSLPSETQLQPPGETAVPSEEIPTARKITVTGTEFKFEPSEIKAAPGERLRIIFVNAGSAPHNLTIEGLEVATNTVGPGQQSGVEFTVPAEGEYPLTVFCSVPGHRERGMVGTLVVE